MRQMITPYFVMCYVPSTSQNKLNVRRRGSTGGSELTLFHTRTGFSGSHSGLVQQAGPAVGSRFGNLSLLPISSHQPHLATSIHLRERDQLDTYLFLPETQFCCQIYLSYHVRLAHSAG